MNPAENHKTAPHKVELVCPAGSLPALKAAVDNGADAVYMGFKDATNARNFPGLNFDLKRSREGIRYAHDHGARVLLALNTYPQTLEFDLWTRAVDMAAELGADALIVADPGVMQYAARTHPELRLHLSVQGSATSHQAIRFYQQRFGIQRVVLPRVLSLPQVRQVVANSPVEVEVFAFGSLCVMAEGRCTLSSYVTGDSPNNAGVCSPAHAVRWEEHDSERKVRLNGVLIDAFGSGENAGYPTLCKGRFNVQDKVFYALEEPTSLNVLDILPELIKIGVSAIKVEGRQRSPSYVAHVTGVLRQALDSCLADPDHYTPRPDWMMKLDKVAEGSCHTLGALDRPWQ